jgi:hypothetical protein
MSLLLNQRYSPCPGNRRSYAHDAKIAIHIPVLEQRGKTA